MHVSAKFKVKIKFNLENIFYLFNSDLTFSYKKTVYTTIKMLYYKIVHGFLLDILRVTSYIKYKIIDFHF